MRNKIILLFFIPFLITLSQEIYISKDTLNILEYSYLDSLVIYNTSNDTLVIDSIKCTYDNYILNFDTVNDSTKWHSLKEFFDSSNIVEIPPKDSLPMRMSFAIILTKTTNSNNTQVDTLNIYNNSTNMSIQQIMVNRTDVVGAVEKETLSKYINITQNYPNPFNPNTKIRFSINTSGNVVISIYDNLGKEITTLINQYMSLGEYEVYFDGHEFPSGVYYYQIRIGQGSITKKMLLLK